jgi:preprotein translocase subunit SecG
MFAIFVLVINIISALALVALILLHSGRGGGLSEMIAGSSGISPLGASVTERNLDRITVLALEIFAFTSVILALLWS